jgi:undecaprenyl-diphosphatase
MNRLNAAAAKINRALRGDPQAGWVAALCLCTFCLFSGLAGEVLEGDLQGFDQKILLSMRDPNNTALPLGGPWLEEVMRDATAMGGVFLVSFISLAVFIYLAVQRRRGEASYLAGSIVTGLAFSSLLKQGFHRPRPELFPHGSMIYTSSFPSGHSLMSALVYLTLGALLAAAQDRRGVKIYILSLSALVTLIVGLSRVYLAVHWPSDVLAGWLAGAAWAMLSWLVWTRLLHRHQRSGKKGSR